MSMSREKQQGRREFLKTSAAAAAVTIAPGVMLHTLSADAAPRTEPVTDKVRWGMLIDANKCADGCTECVAACDKENGLDLVDMPEGADPSLWERQRPRWIRQVKLKDNLSGRITNLPMMCQHCEEPPCVDVCPTGASFRRADGIVMVDRHICIGCRYCMMACPYKARSFIHAEVAEKLTHTPRGKGCVESCNFCVQRLDNGESTTACQEACKHQAIVFGDLNDPDSAVSQALKKYPSVQIRADLKLNTGVRYSNI
ncbi:MAG TPA: 4Fe-4S dicluster domain-containing protein [Thiolapillus brandeum]|uniref:4Fe-4S dicluster domain-containing protein n=1 Tax=Thiolapillus brandeum TaxID=1076588 RepID=A0A831S0R3_9GAMM|nr:4Fe-4S dicluster domain-containing protein [Thiolapillus brandeum]